jgi:hypothetical protein
LEKEKGLMRRLLLTLGGLAIVAASFFATLSVLNYMGSRSPDPLSGVKLLAEQRSALLGARDGNGAIDLQTMRRAGVRVPGLFIRNEAFASPWGSSRIAKQGDHLVWDFSEIDPAACTQLLEDSKSIAGVVGVASSASSVDERTPPLTHDVAAKECGRTPLMVRLMLKQ